MKEYVQKKVFIVTNIIMCLIIVVIFNIPNIINSFEGGNEEGKKVIAIIDESNMLINSLDMINQTSEEYEYIIGDSKDKEVTKEKVKNGEIYATAIINENEESLNVEYIVKNQTAQDELNVRKHSFYIES